MTTEPAAEVTPQPDAIISPVIAAAKAALTEVETKTPEEIAAAEAAKTETTTETNEQTPEEKAAAEAAAKAEEEAKAKEAEAPQGAPETYEDFQFPEGITPDAEIVTEFKEIAKAANLDQETAQKVAGIAPKIIAKMAEAQMEAVNKVVDGWAEQTKADKELGGDKLTENLAVAQKAMQAFATPELRSLLNKFDKVNNPNGTGLGNHPEFIRLMHRVGKTISEDKIVTGNEPGHTGQSAADKLYGNKTK